MLEATDVANIRASGREAVGREIVVWLAAMVMALPSCQQRTAIIL